MRSLCGGIARRSHIVSWTVAAAVLGAVAVLLRRRGRREAVNPAPAPAAPGDIHGTVHALLGPRGLVTVDGLVEPARWQGPGEPPGRGGIVRLTREDETAMWDATPLRDALDGDGAA
ncbi:hypothetical protein [Streptomyces griseoruber]|uniref:hypothetical protein n=1 Tax=Streptomyces griseoruber TaxID=1943 RepID=UPI000ABF1BAE|nr:hypothetical protein [Streptomyces griseoruber]